jgi:hypothetical protein
MGNIFSVHSVGSSIITRLRNAYPQELRDEIDCDFALFSSKDMHDGNDLTTTTVALYLYRITMDQHLRGRERITPDQGRNTPLALDLHYLFTIWTTSVYHEQSVMAWLMRELYQYPVLDRSALMPEAEWRPDDIIHLIPSELTTEDIMRVWEGLGAAYRLSFSYIARVVRIDVTPEPENPPVIVKRFGYRNWDGLPGGDT